MKRMWNMSLGVLNEVVAKHLGPKTRVTLPMLESIGCYISQTGGAQDTSTYELAVPANRVDLFDLGGVAASVLCLLRNQHAAEDTGDEPESMPRTLTPLPECLDWSLEVFPPNERMVLAVLAYWDLFSSRDDTDHISPGAQSFREMLAFLNADFGKAVGQRCRVDLFDLQTMLPEHQPYPQVEMRWEGNSEYSVSFDQKGKLLPSPLTQLPENGLLVIQGGTRDVVIGIAHSLMRSMRLFGSRVFGLRTRQAATALEVIDLSSKTILDARQVPTRLNPHTVERWLGEWLHPFKLQSVLKGLGYRAETGLGTLFYVELEVPAYRFDVRDEVDVIGDITSALGYDARRPGLLRRTHAVSTAPVTIGYGKEDEIENRSMDVRQTLVGLGFREVVTPLIVQDTDEGDPLVADDPLSRSRLVRLEATRTVPNPVLRRHLYTQLLDYLRQHLAVAAKPVVTQPGQQDRRHWSEGSGEPERHHAFFEVGDVYEEDPAAVQSACVQCRRYLSGIISHDIQPHPGRYSSRYETLFEETKAIVLAILAERFGRSRERLELAPLSSPLFIHDRAAVMRMSSGRPLGRFGEISAEVLTAHHVGWPTTLFEIDMTDLY